MSWYVWIIIGYQILNILASVALVGKVRPPITSGGAIFQILISYAQIAVIVELANG